MTAPSSRQERVCEPPGCRAARVEQADREQEEEGQAECHGIAPRKPRARERHADLAEHLHHAREMGAPKRLGEGIAFAHGELVVKCRERAVGKHAVALDAALGGGNARQAQHMGQAIGRPAEGQAKAQEEQEMKPAGEKREETDEGKGREKADDADRGPRGRP